MPGQAFFRGLSLRIVAGPIALFLIGLCSVLCLCRSFWRGGESQEGRARARALFHLAAVDHHAERHLAAFTALSSRMQPPQAASPAQADPAVEQILRVRRVALHPTAPEHTADAYEESLLTTFRQDPGRRRIETEVARGGHRFQVIAAPVVLTEGRCLTCHGSPKRAPRERLRLYGRTNGFGWKPGETVGATVVYMRADTSGERADTLLRMCCLALFLLALSTAALLVRRTHRLVARPAGQMLAACQAVRRGEPVPEPAREGADEMALLGTWFHDTARWLQERADRAESQRALYQQFVPASESARALLTQTDRVIVGSRHPMTVMVINIRNFRLLMENLSPAETVSTLNAYFTAVNEVVVRHNGLVSKYLGDSVLALFGAQPDAGTHALDAVRASLALPASLQDLYVRLDEEYGWRLGVGVGICTGQPIVGSFGSWRHREFAVLGDVVAEAQRLEAATKSVPEEDTILLCETTYRLVAGRVHAYDLGERQGADNRPLRGYVLQGMQDSSTDSLHGSLAA